jgi:DNA-binding CsgD family transcriptional regulator
VFTELSKDKRDASVVLQAIKLQADLQEKKLNVSRSGGASGEAISKSYIYKRDEEIAKLKSQGFTEEELAAKFSIGIMSIKQSLDRVQLKLPDELKTLNPTIISETIGLDRDTRIKILKEALDNQMGRAQVREMIVKFKNNSR